MKKLYTEAEDVPQTVANRAAKVVEKHLRKAQVDRARELPEEARVRLFRDIRALYDSEGSSGNRESMPNQEGFWTRLMTKVEGFLSFGDLEPNTYIPYAYCATMPFCDSAKQMSAPMIKGAAASAQPGQTRRGC